MAFKNFQHEDLQIKIYKRKASRLLRLSVLASGEVRVTIPAWAPYKAGLEFAQSRQSWIRTQLPPSRLLLSTGTAIGKAHHLRFVPSSSVQKPVGRVGKTEIVVHYPVNLTVADPAVQQTAQNACIRALRSQAELLLPERLRWLAATHGFSYNRVTIKRLSRRWGSCDNQQNIVLNLYLMQLPWQYIDYVLLHELTHTRVMQHGPRFWAEMTKVLPDTHLRRKAMRAYQPLLFPATDETLTMA